MTGVVAAIAEAWSQVRVHKARVILSLLGVFLAVLTMTTAAAIGRIGQQMIAESFESMAGRSATLSVSLFSASMEQPSVAEISEVFDEFVARHEVAYSSKVVQSQLTIKTGGPAQRVDLMVVEPDYGIIHRITPLRGRWFTEADRGSLSPTVLVNEAMADLLGMTGDQPHKVQIAGDTPRLATVIGVMTSPSDMPMIIAIDSLGSGDSFGAMPMLEMWVPPADASQMQAIARSELSAAIPGGMADAYRMDAGDTSAAIDSALTTAITWVGLLLLGLGALGVVNVAIVTVRQRIREIGIRRSFGASSRRVFATVMLETTLATAAAGALAVAAAIAIVPRLPIADWVAGGLPITTIPPFPIEVALQGVAASTALGLLAGLIPAIIAVRANPVEAIRF